MVDPLVTKLTNAVPGATIEERPGNPPDQRFVVLGKSPLAPKRGSSQLSHGATRSEAVDRAVWLFGARR